VAHSMDRRKVVLVTLAVLSQAVLVGFMVLLVLLDKG